MLNIGRHARKRMKERRIDDKMVAEVFRDGLEVDSYQDRIIQYLVLEHPIMRDNIECRAVAIVHGDDYYSHGDRFVVTCEWVSEKVLHEFEQCRKHGSRYYSKAA